MKDLFLVITVVLMFAVQPICMSMQRESEDKQNVPYSNAPQSSLLALWKKAGEKVQPKDVDEVDKKLQTACGHMAFNFTSMRKEVLQARLTELFEISTPLPLVLIGLTLDYCRGWKKHAHIPTLEAYTDIIRAHFAVHRGKRVVVAQDDRVYFDSSEDPTTTFLNCWDIETGALCAQIPGCEEGFFDLQVTSDGQKIVSGCNKSTVINVHDANSLKQIAQFSFGSLNDQLRFAVSPDDTLLAVIPSSNFVHIFDFKHQILLQKLALRPYHGHSGGDSAVCFSPNGRLIAAYSNDYIAVWEISIRDISTRFKRIKDWRVFGFKNPCLKFINNRTLMSCQDFETSELVTWDISTPGKDPSKKVDQTYVSLSPICFAYSPECDCLAVSLLSKPFRVVIADAVTGSEISTVTLGSSDGYGRTDHLSFSPDGQYITAAHTWGSGSISLLYNSYDVQE